jgi:hypothetical protein
MVDFLSIGLYWKWHSDITYVQWNIKVEQRAKRFQKVELYNFILISGSDCSAKCVSRMTYLMCGGTPWVVFIECRRKQGPKLQKDQRKFRALVMHRWWYAPNLLYRLKYESKVKTMKEQGVGAHSFIRNTLEVEGCAKAPRWGLGRVTSINYSHGPAQPNNKLVSA